MSFKSLIARLLQTARNQVYRLDDLAIKQGTKFADTTLNTFENKIENKIGTPLPIDFSIDELLDGKLTNLSSTARDKIKIRKDEISKLYPNISKARKILKWKPKIKLNIGLKKTINY